MFYLLNPVFTFNNGEPQIWHNFINNISFSAIGSIIWEIRMLKVILPENWKSKYGPPHTNILKSWKYKKKQHWEDLLEDIDNIWSIARYFFDHTLRPSLLLISWVNFRSETMAIINVDIEKTLLKSFFPLLSPYLLPNSSANIKNKNPTFLLPISLIQKEDV